MLMLPAKEKIRALTIEIIMKRCPFADNQWNL